MGKNVYANNLEVSGKASDHMCIAAMPDVCLSPPSPPAGPIPIPYPNTSKAKDLKAGSKDVKIGGQPVCLGSDSHYNSSPLGNEACTKTFGMNVIDHNNSGNTHCQAHSMDVTVEDTPVTRTSDLTTSNHMSKQPGGGAMTAQLAGAAPPGGDNDSEDTCECCGGPVHSEAQRNGDSMTQTEWYNPDLSPRVPPTKKDKLREDIVSDCNTLIEWSREYDCGSVHEDESDPCAKHYEIEKTDREPYESMISPSTSDEYLLERFGPIVGQMTIRHRATLTANAADPSFVGHAHKTALAAGGCPIGEGNIQSVYGEPCGWIESQLGQRQGRIKNIRNGKAP